MHHRLRLRHPSRRRDLLIVGLLVLAAVTALLPGMAAGARERPPDRLGEFLWWLAGRESGWRWTARNTWSGAYGRYQIMPVNWPHWADDHIGDRWAEQTPRNQELVARGKIAALHRWLGGWRRVAYWWLTGDTRTNETTWSDTALGYVDDVMALMKRAPEGGDPVPPETAGDDPPADRGDWRYVVEGATLFADAGGGGRRSGRLRDGQVVFVQGVRWSETDVLWLHVSTAGDDMGWITIRRTVPARKPSDAHRWPKDRVTDPDAERRERSRPRPR